MILNQSHFIMKTNILLALAFAGLLTSCSPTYTYFTKDLYEQEKWSQEDITRIQFYVSKDIVLSRSMSSGETSISEGKIKIKNGQRVEQVIIRSGTPGVLVLMPVSYTHLPAQLLASDIVPLFIEFNLLNGEVFIECFSYAAFKVPDFLGLCGEVQEE